MLLTGVTDKKKSFVYALLFMRSNENALHCRRIKNTTPRLSKFMYEINLDGLKASRIEMFVRPEPIGDFKHRKPKYDIFLTPY